MPCPGSAYRRPVPWCLGQSPRLPRYWSQTCNWSNKRYHLQKSLALTLLIQLPNTQHSCKAGRYECLTGETEADTLIDLPKSIEIIRVEMERSTLGRRVAIHFCTQKTPAEASCIRDSWDKSKKKNNMNYIPLSTSHKELERYLKHIYLFQMFCLDNCFHQHFTELLQIIQPHT